MAQDLYGNTVGKYAIISANEAKITFSATGQSAMVLGANIQYNMPITPVATFGGDVIFAKGTPQGTFTFSAIAGSTGFVNKAQECLGDEMSCVFGVSGCIMKTDIDALKNMNASNAAHLHGAVFNQFSIQGQAQDAFFTHNVGGFFHYMTWAKGSTK